MSGGLPRHAVQAVLQSTVGNSAVEWIKAVPSFHLQRTYNIQLADGRKIVLTLPPPPRLGLMRCEQNMTASEAAIISNLRDQRCSRAGPCPNQKCESAMQPEPLLEFLPRLLDCSTSWQSEFGSPYNLFDEICGVPFSTMSKQLSPRQRKHIEFQAGQLLGGVAGKEAPASRFGPVIDVMEFESRSIAKNEMGSHPTRNMVGTAGESWSTAFHAMFEDILRDGEDLAVMLPYGVLRGHLDRTEFRDYLDAVAVPRLVILDGAEEANMLVVPATNIGAQETTTTKIKIEADEEKGHGEDLFRLVGLRDWSSGVFGDPLMAKVFSRTDISADFTEGFAKGFSAVSSARDEKTRDEASRDVRLLLYQAYHASAAVVREFYRPRSDSSGRELAARKALTEALHKLSIVQ